MYRVERQLIGGGIHVYDTHFATLDEIRTTFNLMCTPQVDKFFQAKIYGSFHQFRVIQWGKSS
jgi:hypothetical protein